MGDIGGTLGEGKGLMAEGRLEAAHKEKRLRTFITLWPDLWLQEVPRRPLILRSTKLKMLTLRRVSHRGGEGKER